MWLFPFKKSAWLWLGKREGREGQTDRHGGILGSLSSDSLTNSLSIFEMKFCRRLVHNVNLIAFGI